MIFLLLFSYFQIQFQLAGGKKLQTATNIWQVDRGFLSSCPFADTLAEDELPATPLDFLLIE